MTQQEMVWDPHLLRGRDGWIGGNRIPPVGRAADYQTFAILRPSDLAERAACEEVGCGAYRNGWETGADERTAHGAAIGAYIRNRSRRDFTECKRGDGWTIFRFKSGQRCFQEHLTVPQIFRVRDGDWRGNPTGRRRDHVNPADWVEDFGLHQIKVAEQVQGG